MKKGIGTRLYDANQRLGIHRVTNKMAQAVGKKDCGCKKRANKIDAIEEGISNTISSMFQKNKNKK